MNNLDTTYTNLLSDILDNGVVKGDRTGTGTTSVFGRQIRHNMAEGFPLLTTKKMAYKSIIVELLWFLKGDTNIKYLVDNGCNIWTGDCYAAYMKNKEHLHESGRPFSKAEFTEKIKTNDEFAKKWGDLGPIYGKQWRNWGSYKDKFNYIDNGKGEPVGARMSYDGIDQIANVIDQLRNNPDSRRIMVNAWNVSEIDNMTLPPCHYGFQLYTRKLSLDERTAIWDKKYLKDVNPEDAMDRMNFHNIPERAISLMWNQRSVDTFLGLPFNIASYGLLLEIFANEVGMIPDQLIANLGDTHLYSNHLDQAREQIGSELSDVSLNGIFKEMDGENFEAFVTSQKLMLEAVEKQNFEVAAIHRDTKVKAKKALAKLDLPLTDRQPYELPQMKIADKHFEDLTIEDFELIGYKSHPAIKAPLSN
mgnify:CR=1 FL=1|tara:strand:- start:1632 stop:2888 length:1257 start_codon:yes stop_codon:yes gene_type:complete